MNFQQSLLIGKTGENAIARYLKIRGSQILPVYEKADNEYKGPALYTSEGGSLIAPDMLVFSKCKIIWVEAKNKTAFAWHRISQTWTTGIDAHHFEQYLKIREICNLPLWILFIQNNGTAKDTPDGMKCPTGLFGDEILRLKNKIHHTHPNWGKNGMVYWSSEDLQKIADLSELTGEVYA